ncbi:MAG: twin-arginine translocation signal domain-containing protein [Faecalibacterium sp.]
MAEKMTRRTFMKSAAAAAAAISLSGVLTGCGGSGHRQTTRCADRTPSP